MHGLRRPLEAVRGEVRRGVAAAGPGVHAQVHGQGLARLDAPQRAEGHKHAPRAFLLCNGTGKSYLKNGKLQGEQKEEEDERQQQR